ncbi:hypothetical protein PISL3812_07831 [Talaromyces islandicus]|uniref:Uncharacterized protein n=1 Tax=Talaromyces islandicus TaxID=28573 RepID=A0A0U1M7A2_TALIS|nr:hypothetical protein PISL3812_07831 [Talaromyces islandicus]
MSPFQTAGNGQPMQDTSSGHGNSPQTIKIEFEKCEDWTIQQPQCHSHVNSSGHGSKLNIQIAQRETTGSNRQDVDLHTTETNCQGGTTHRHLSIRSEYEQIPAQLDSRAIPQSQTRINPQVDPRNIPQAQPCGPGDTTALNALAEVSVRELTFLQNYVKSESVKYGQ